MKKLLLTTIAALTILFTQAQCQAHFGYGQNGATISFTDSSITQSTNSSATWSWDFGDGNSSTQQNPVHTYSNGTYNACLTITFLDLVSMNTCVSTYCESIFIGNTPPASWDCDPVNGCVDPGTGNGQYTTLAACQAVCPTPTWDCDPVTGCYDPGTGLGQYISFIHCDTTCGSVNTPSWDCNPVNGVCNDPGTGNGQYTTLAACQSNCSTMPNYCDSITVTGSQSAFTAEVNNINTIVEHWLTTSNNYADTLQYDNMTNTINIVGITYDTIITCITYVVNNGTYTCCETWIWDALLGSWARMSGVTLIGEINLFNKKLIKVVDVLGRETSINSNQTLFFIYEDGTIEKRYIIDTK